MRKRIFACLAALCALAALSGCGCDNGENADLVFVNGSNILITSVEVETVGHSQGAQYADHSPLKYSESFGFEVGEYPATVTIYAGSRGGVEEELARFTVNRAPAEGERWYVTAQESVDGLTLTADVRWPEWV